jgi:hypothetical protein
VKLFECQNCGQPLYFENTQCEKCGLRLAYLADAETITAVHEASGEFWRPLAVPERLYRFCRNARHDVCNWLIRGDHKGEFCIACRHNRTIPDLSTPGNIPKWQKIEFAKHRLLYTVLKLRLPLTMRPEDPNGLAFDFLSPAAGGPGAKVMTGHASGLITLNVTEADDLERERQRKAMGEPYRTLLGHFRHEIGHYYWDHLVAGSPVLDEFREVFGDERQDYQEALQRHYAQGAPTDWVERYVTPYASAHPWEDFAETWAHYLHMVDTLETAASFGVRLRPDIADHGGLEATFDFDPHTAPLRQIIDNWLPLTFAVNSMNRSMGQPDLYPFVISPVVVAKLAFISDRVIRAGAGNRHER